MQATKLIRAFLSFLLFLAERDARRAAEQQKQFKKQQQARADVLREERDRLRNQADRAAAEAATCAAHAALGCNNINEAERTAATLARQLRNVAA